MTTASGRGRTGHGDGVGTSGAVGDRDTLSPVAEVLSEVVQPLRPLEGVHVPLRRALGRTLAEDVTAAFPLPPHDNTAMDGFAVRSADLAAARVDAPVTLPLAAPALAGAGRRDLPSGHVSVITTGAVLPVGADAVVRREHASATGDRVTFTAPVEVGADVRRRGEDVAADTRVLRRGSVVGPGQVAAAAATGRQTLKVCGVPRTALVLTGDEVVVDGAALRPGQVHDAIGPALAALIEAVGCRVDVVGPVADTTAALVPALEQAAGAADIVVTVGGVSVGHRDLVTDAVARLGRARSWKVALRPAKPFASGDVGGVPLFCLPGNPVSALVAYEVFVRPALQRLGGRVVGASTASTARLVAPFEQRPGRLHFVRGVCWHGGDGLEARPVGAQGAGMVHALAAANAWLVVPPDVSRLAVGDPVEVRPVLPAPGWPVAPPVTDPAGPPGG